MNVLVIQHSCSWIFKPFRQAGNQEWTRLQCTARGMLRSWVEMLRCRKSLVYRSKGTISTWSKPNLTGAKSKMFRKDITKTKGSSCISSVCWAAAQKRADDLMVINGSHVARGKLWKVTSVNRSSLNLSFFTIKTGIMTVSILWYYCVT